MPTYQLLCRHLHDGIVTRRKRTVDNESAPYGDDAVEDAVPGRADIDSDGSSSPIPMRQEDEDEDISGTVESTLIRPAASRARGVLARARTLPSRTPPSLPAAARVLGTSDDDGSTLSPNGDETTSFLPADSESSTPSRQHTTKTTAGSRTVDNERSRPATINL